MPIYAPYNSFSKVNSSACGQACVPRTQKVTRENILQEIPSAAGRQLPRLLCDAMLRILGNNETPPDFVKKKKKAVTSHGAILQVGGRPRIPSFRRASPSFLI